MSLTFPANPSTGDTYTAADNTWYWDGTKWRTYGIQGAVGPAGATGSAGNDLPKITAVTYADSGYTSNGASIIAPSTAGYIYLTGSNFQSGCSVYVNNTAMTTTYVSSTRINVAISSLSADIYHIYFYNPDGGTTVSVNGLIIANPGSGGTITNSGSYTIHTFTDSGTFTLLTAKTVDYLVVAGGGGGGGSSTTMYQGGGGGAGGYRSFTSQSLTSGSYSVTVGAGGNGPPLPYPSVIVGTNGNDSIFNSSTSAGGGYGGSWQYNSGNAANGGSGGGGAANGGTGGAGNTPSTSPSQGNNGAIGGGGGGAGATGVTRIDNYSGGGGGIGVANTISGSSVYYAKGGNCGLDIPLNGTPNTGNGGQGGGPNVGYTYGANGGSGIVIIRYLT